MLARLVSVLWLLTFAAATQPAIANSAAPPLDTDFNLVTAVDASDSITRHDEWLQYSGLARGVVHSDFLCQIGQGLSRRIGFLAFTWSSGSQIQVIVPWTVVANPQDAADVAAQLRAAPRIDRSHYDGNHQAPEQSRSGRALAGGGMTDIAAAIDAAIRLSLDSPFQGRRTVINILSNGIDNAGSTPDALRDAAVRQGATINGIVFGSRRDLPAYFERNVIGGPGAFLMTVRDPADLSKALERKFWRDLIAVNAVAADSSRIRFRQRNQDGKFAQGHLSFRQPQTGMND